jgi:Arc/MetJ family transcription regulator
VVYVARTNIDIDDELINRAMQLYGLRTKRDAVNLALLHLVGAPMDRAEALAMEGRGWGADLADLRAPDEPAGP